MSKRGLSALHEVLTIPLGPHSDDETIAELATTEAAGEDIEARYPSQVRHIESCSQCSLAYGELVEMMLSAVRDASAVISPQDVYADMLLKDIGKRVAQFPRLPELIRQIVTILPSGFVNHPTSAADVSTEGIERIIQDTGVSPNKSSKLISTISQSIGRHLPALSLFLTGMAESAWGRTVGVKTSLIETWQTLQIHPMPEPAIPTLSGRETGREWQIFRQHMGHPTPLNITAWAERVSPLACSVSVQIDRPGLQDVAGRSVQLKYGNQTRTTETDQVGIACFDSVPIAAIPDIEILFQNK